MSFFNTAIFHVLACIGTETVVPLLLQYRPDARTKACGDMNLLPWAKIQGHGYGDGFTEPGTRMFRYQGQRWAGSPELGDGEATWRYHQAVIGDGRSEGRSSERDPVDQCVFLGL
ncbi:uncharacterized protein PV07_01850 [Cladophialophora immunda]|uniref:Uncharacterized protein n=1 Tax=Cladophialophora immunda TaxID=569365 RepID=A0A0D2CYY0_9EURO|nr:uncharacterized protein PV07_01850 [Cladophialophora immunda]KIW35135.1 hypothetical protein PV07_01850 [Cladophialophora immunda]